MESNDPNMEDLMMAEDIDFDRILQCVFGIQPHETRTFFTLRENSGSTVTELAADLDRDRSSVNRSLSTLTDKGLVERERRLLDGGGFVYQYYTVPLSTAKTNMHTSVDEWAKHVHSQIESIDQ